jgi:hypothetical protein
VSSRPGPGERRSIPGRWRGSSRPGQRLLPLIGELLCLDQDPLLTGPQHQPTALVAPHRDDLADPTVLDIGDESPVQGHVRAHVVPDDQLAGIDPEHVLAAVGLGGVGYLLVGQLDGRHCRLSCSWRTGRVGTGSHVLLSGVGRTRNSTAARGRGGGHGLAQPVWTNQRALLCAGGFGLVHPCWAGSRPSTCPGRWCGSAQSHSGERDSRTSRTPRRDPSAGKRVGMLRRMTRITVTMDDRLAEAVRAAAGANVSGWLAKVARAELLRQAVAAEVTCDQEHPEYLAWRAERLEEIHGAQG